MDATVYALKGGSEAPAPTRRREPLPIEDDGGGELLACARCLRAVTTSGARIEVGGAHEHRFANPSGYRYHIGCFARASGCVPVGQASTYWTWFPGFSWQIEQCGECGEHLGWRFRSADSVFHGLILARLVEVEERA
jgi:hypothetical protein